MADVFNWFEHHVGLTIGLATGWLVMLIAALWGGRWFLISIPPDYFSQRHRPLEKWHDSHPAVRWILLVGKNSIGAILFVAGIIMLFTPGQGILSLLFGLALLDFPGKRAVERWIIERHSILAVVNRIRARAGRPALQMHRHEETAC